MNSRIPLKGKDSFSEKIQYTSQERETKLNLKQFRGIAKLNQFSPLSR